MALPATISGVEFPWQNYHVGPFEDGNGNLYAILVDSSDSTILRAVKSSDGGETWSAQDTGSSTFGSSPKASVWVVQNGTELLVAHQDLGTSGMDNVRDIRFSKFYTSDDGSNPDTWDGFGTVATVASIADGDSRSGCSLVIRSNGDLIVVAQGPSDKVMGNNYSRVYYYKSTDDGANWSGGTLVSGTSSDETWYTGPVAAVGASDRVHIFYRDASAGTLRHRSLSSSDALDTDAGWAGNDASNTYPYTEARYDSANTTVELAYRDSNGNLDRIEVPSEASPTIPTASTITTTNVYFDGDDSLVASFDLDGSNIHNLYADSSTQDLFYGVSEEILDGVTIEGVSSKVIGTDYTYVYDDGGTVKYNTHALAAETGDQSQISWAELEVPLAPRQLQLSWGELEVPDSPRTSQVSWAELETPDAARTSQTSWAELEAPDAPRQLQFSWGEFETPDGPRTAQFSWTELEVEDAPRQMQLSWGELETPDAGRTLQASWAEFEVPDAPRQLQLSWGEVEVPEITRTMQASWFELETPDGPRKLQTSWAELEVPDEPRQLQLSWTELETPDAARTTQTSWAEFEVPDGPRALQTSWVEFETPDAARTSQVSWVEMETPSEGRTSQLSWAELEAPDGPRTTQLSWAELEVPNEPRFVQFSWAEVEVPTAPRSAQVSWEELEVPAQSKAQVSWVEMSTPNAPGAALTKRDRVYFPGKEWKTPKPRE